MRAFIFGLIFLLAAVVPLAQAVTNGYDRQFLPPGPLSTWQVRIGPDQEEQVTVWGQTFSLPTDAWATAVRDAGPYVRRLADAGDSLERWAAYLREDLPGFGGSPRSTGEK